MMKYYIDILKEAAKYHLMVNFHGATIPRGWARTYPNLMTTYIGGLNGRDQTQTLIVRFDFPDKGNYKFQIIKDGSDKGSFSSEIIKIKKGDTLKIECLPRGGFVGVLEVQK